MDIILEPSLISISHLDCQSEEGDEFLTHWLDNLNRINEHRIGDIIWSDELETSLWSQPNFPPWKHDRSTRNAYIQVIFRLLRNKMKILISTSDSLCKVCPCLDRSCCNNDTYCSILRIINFQVSNSNEFVFCIGASKKGIIYSMTSSNGREYQPKHVYNAEDWWSHIDATQYWPINRTILDKDGLKKAIEITAKQKFTSVKKILYDFDFSDTFMKDVIDNCTDKHSILEACARRLVLTLQEASKNNSLKDKEFKGKGRRKRSFRVTKGARIHYRCIGIKEILFDNYYPEGEHDSRYSR